MINQTHHIDALEFIKTFEAPIDLIVSDPPYEFEAMGGGVHRVQRGEVKYQNILDIETNHFDFEKYIPAMLDKMGDRVNAYFFCNKVLVPKYLNEALRRELNFDILCLRKMNPIPAKQASYCPEVEYIIFLRSPGVYFDGTRKLENYKKVFDVNIGGQNEFHPNQKPVELLKRFIMNSCPRGGGLCLTHSWALEPPVSQPCSPIAGSSVARLMRNSSPSPTPEPPKPNDRTP